jgi:hypothetical protein
MPVWAKTAPDEWAAAAENLRGLVVSRYRICTTPLSDYVKLDSLAEYNPPTISLEFPRNRTD